MLRIGHGYDVHRFVKGRRFILGGVEIDYEYGLLGHSDADVLLHAICDAILGALGLGDIGKHFPDTDSAYAGIDSRELLRNVITKMEAVHYRLGNLDCTIICQKPKLAPYIAKMVDLVASDCKVASGMINIKATTSEELGFTGRGEGIAAHAVVLLQRDERKSAAKRAAIIS
ncbi:2-C-methyl-D-erythritol 2,4-cyclodiphosphate synthase [Desulfuromusa kysingii]|uniref:2-C-methyl-D-erythritol 2,4-cyclodiphosphate synthase n=1 Tax=Desulfuromusa kysingii TaxID=37625 RepID=A0A1H4ARR9_9BACT|nr:2-C-methyl-D-erythritol 2,4-cyclodiphosphate synthase [Desulfuromusa kysingii]SEA38655.1 2-C-methyl-D-erythritol 2,4-cyclodiphosphate synthase [Desulfuromusa kysingii]